MTTPSAADVAALLGDWPARGSGPLAAPPGGAAPAGGAGTPGTAAPPDSGPPRRAGTTGASGRRADRAATPPTMAGRLLGAAERGINFGISAPPAAAQLPKLAVSSAD